MRKNFETEAEVRQRSQNYQDKRGARRHGIRLIYCPITDIFRLVDAQGVEINDFELSEAREALSCLMAESITYEPDDE